MTTTWNDSTWCCINDLSTCHFKILLNAQQALLTSLIPKELLSNLLSELEIIVNDHNDVNLYLKARFSLLSSSIFPRLPIVFQPILRKFFVKRWKKKRKKEHEKQSNRWRRKRCRIIATDNDFLPYLVVSQYKDPGAGYVSHSTWPDVWINVVKAQTHAQMCLA